MKNVELRQDFLTEVVKNIPEIPASLMRDYIEKPEDLQEILFSAFFVSHGFKIWKTIKINGNQDLGKINRRMKKAKINIGGAVNSILKEVDFSKTRSKVDVVLLSLEDLGFNSHSERINGVEYEEICYRAQAFGLSLCPIEIALQLRLEYLNQPKKEWIAIGMNPVIVSNEQRLLVLGHNDCGLWLNCVSYKKQDDFWFSKRKIAFISKATL